MTAYLVEMLVAGLVVDRKFSVGEVCRLLKFRLSAQSAFRSVLGCSSTERLVNLQVIIVSLSEAWQVLRVALVVK